MSETQSQEPAAQGAAHNQKPKPAAKVAPQNPNVDMITYMPADGDPVRTVWNGIEFTAHIPVAVPKSKTILVPTKIRTPMKDEDGKPMLDDAGKQQFHDGVLQPDGTLQTRHVEKPIAMVELAKGNCRFSVNGAAPSATKLGKMRQPTNSDEYRGYALAWIASATDPAQMDARWANEKTLRETCGCTEQDEASLLPFFEARHDVAKAA